MQSQDLHYKNKNHHISGVENAKMCACSIINARTWTSEIGSWTLGNSLPQLSSRAGPRESVPGSRIEPSTVDMLSKHVTTLPHRPGVLGMV